MRWYFYILFIGLCFDLKAQCGISKTFTIVDLPNGLPDTTNISLLVSGAVNNNLANVAQGLCGIQLKFSHPFEKELFFELISPSGEVITVVGGDVTAYNTPLITWDVLFVPCLFPAVPDPGFSEVWENDQDWLSLTQYTGSYYPHMGCLEDFDTGSVNGTWTLRCIDFADEGIGKLLGFNLIFCDETGINCGECKLDPGIITNLDTSFCSGDTGLLVQLNKLYPVFAPNDTIYEYKNIVFKDSVVFAYTTSNDLRSFPPGSYTICGVQVSKTQLALLPLPGSNYISSSLNNYFFQLGACASVSDSCLVVQIFDQPDTVSITRYICKGDNFELGGQSYNTQDTFIVVIENGVCDSLIKLDLRVIDIEAQIIADRDSVSCLANTNTLQGFNIGTPNSTILYDWFSTNSTIDTDTTAALVDISNAGTFCLSLTAINTNFTCKDTTCKEIFLDVTNPVLNLTTDTITCLKDTVSISLAVSRPLQVPAVWTSSDGNPFIIDSNGIRVWKPGRYVVSVLADNNCSAVDSILVIEDRYFKNPDIVVDTLTCALDSVQVLVSLDSLYLYDYQWTNVRPEYVNAQNPYVFNPQNISLLMTNIRNGCNRSFEVSIPVDTIAPIILSVSKDTITCLKSFVNPIAQVNVDSINYFWMGQGFMSNLPSPAITSQGAYKVTVTSRLNGCSASTFFTIEKDTLIPLVTLSVDSISCVLDTVIIRLTASRPLESTVWSGPDLFTSSDPEPKVYNEGTYILSFTGKNGCVGQSAIFVPNSFDIPKTYFGIDTIKCGFDTITIRIDSTRGSYNYNWEGPGLLESNIGTPRIIEAGMYHVTITNPTTLCTDEVAINIIDDRIYSEIMISVGALDCQSDSVQIMLTNTDINSVSYTGPASFFSTKQSPFVRVPGIYNYSIINYKNCISNGFIEVVTNDTLPLLTIVPPVFTCFTDSVQLFGISTIPGTTFSWKGPQGFLKSGDGSYAYLGGDYMVLGIAPNGCKASLPFKIGYDTLPPVFTIISPDVITCKKDTITLSTTFDFTKGSTKWLPEGAEMPTYEVSSAGNYIAEITGLNLCKSRDTIQVFEDKAFPAFEVNNQIINCKDSLAKIEIIPVSLFESIQWNNTTNPEMIAPNTLIYTTRKPGIYLFEIQNVEGCISKGSIEVSEDKEKPKILDILSDTLDCFQPVRDIGVILDRNGIQFEWNGPPQSGVINLIADSLLAVSLGGQYTLRVTGDNFCIEDTIINVFQNSDVPMYTFFTDTITCDKGKINIGIDPISDIINYDWSGPANFSSTARTPIVSTPGQYTVTITGENGCLALQNIVVTENKIKPVLTIRDTFFLPCDSSQVMLLLLSDDIIDRYKWIFPGGNLVTDMTPSTNTLGEYSVQIVGANGCLSLSKAFYVDLDTRPPGFDVISDTITCDQPLATLKASSIENDVTYQWESPSGLIYMSPVIQTAESGAYTLIVSNVKNCRDTLIVSVSIDTLIPDIIIDKIGDIQCETKDVTLDANKSSQGQEYIGSWSTVDGNIKTQPDKYKIELNAPGSYTFKLVNQLNGCVSSETIEINNSPQLFTNISSQTLSPSCPTIFNGRITLDSLNGTGPYHVFLNNSDMGNRLEFDNLPSGQYDFIITDALGCVLEKSVFLDDGPDLSLTIEKELIIAFGDSVLLLPQFIPDLSGRATLKWESRDSVLCLNCPSLVVTPFVNTLYTLTYSIDGQCGETTTVLVKVNNDIESAIPNIFAPGSGGNNPLFYIPQLRGIDKINYIRIFDRWAENVYHASSLMPGDATVGWDGTFKGKQAATGVYVVFLELTLADGSIWQYQGDLVLLR